VTVTDTSEKGLETLAQLKSKRTTTASTTLLILSDSAGNNQFDKKTAAG